MENGFVRFLVGFRRGFDADCRNLSLWHSPATRQRVQECWRWWHLNGLSDPIQHFKNWHGTVNHNLGCWTPDRMYTVSIYQYIYIIYLMLFSPVIFANIAKVPEFVSLIQRLRASVHNAAERLQWCDTCSGSCFCCLVSRYIHFAIIGQHKKALVSLLKP